MSGPLPLYPGARSCINSGYCCRQAPCPFGEKSKDSNACIHLTADNKCARYDEILAMPQELWYMAPAFGAGCCSPLNPVRLALLAKK